MEELNYENVIKRNDNDFIVFVDLETMNSGYNVVPKSVDPYNAYDIEDVKAYCEANPDKVLIVHPLEEGIKASQVLQSNLAKQEAELEEINKQLFNEMVNLVFESEVQAMPASEEGTMTTEPAETPAVNIMQLLTRRAELMKSIKAIRVQIKQN